MTIHLGANRWGFPRYYPMDFLKITRATQTRNTDYTVFSTVAVGAFAARCTCGSVMPGGTGSYVLMSGCVAFMLSVLQWDIIKYRCGEERPAAMLLTNRVHPVSYLSGPANSSRAPTHYLAETDRAEKTTTTTQHANNTDDGQRTSNSFRLLRILHIRC